MLEDNLFGVRDELLAGTYSHGAYWPFTVFDPKRRLIHKATVRDRVVHQAVVNAVEPLFDPAFVFDSYSCRVGKGTHAAVKRLRKFLRQASVNDARTAYVLKCDVRKFFASVDHAIFLRLVGRNVGGRTLELIKGVVASFSSSPGKGIPLGNLTSQLFANIYLNELDRYVKHGLREKRYVRYCDDFAIVGDDRKALLQLVGPIAEFLGSELSLALHPKKVEIRPWAQGVDFLGYVLMPRCTILRPKTARRMLARVDASNVASYLGLCSHADAYELERNLRVGAWTHPV